MIVYSHRGNYNSMSVENNPDELPLYKWNCEIDLWKIKDKLFLGHDYPKYPIAYSWLHDWSNKLLIHAKNSDAFDYIIKHPDIFGFWHQADDFALTTSPRRVIIYPGKMLMPNAIVMKPELYHWDTLVKSEPYGICTDYPELYS